MARVIPNPLACGDPSPITLFKVGGIPAGVPPSHTMGNNGALTLGTALNHAFSECYMYFAANQIATGVPAGLYYTVMSSTTAGTVYNNTYTGGVPETPTVLVPFVTTGPGANTGVTSEITVFSDTFPGGLVGPNAHIRTTPGLDVSNTTNTRRVFERINGTGLGFNAPATNQTFMRPFYSMFFQNSTARQTSSGSTALGTGTPSRGTVDMSADTTYTISVQHDVATDFIFLAGLLVEVFP